ncbi:MAG: hypothetical protein FJY97_00550 [candidate division Zixibacteria bacterium]|nr:hypothetical protein [candidate division Zixibacteria bacterium]
MKKITNLRLARMIQWTSGAVGWITVLFVFRLLTPLFRSMASLKTSSVTRPETPKVHPAPASNKIP